MTYETGQKGEDLIDLGAASVETKGSTVKNSDGIGRQGLGLSDD